MNHSNLENYITELEDRVSTLSKSIKKIQESISLEAKNYLNNKSHIDNLAKKQANETPIVNTNLELEKNINTDISNKIVLDCLLQMYKI